MALLDTARVFLQGSHDGAASLQGTCGNGVTSGPHETCPASNACCFCWPVSDTWLRGLVCLGLGVEWPWCFGAGPRWVTGTRRVVGAEILQNSCAAVRPSGFILETHFGCRASHSHAYLSMLAPGQGESPRTVISSPLLPCPARTNSSSAPPSLSAGRLAPLQSRSRDRRDRVRPPLPYQGLLECMQPQLPPAGARRNHAPRPRLRLLPL